jgi:hypothetical protein
MDEINFQEKMNQILERIREMPANQAPAAVEAADSATARRERVQTSVNELQDALDYLRLSVKYLVFDLEATRSSRSSAAKSARSVSIRAEGRPFSTREIVAWRKPVFSESWVWFRPCFFRARRMMFPICLESLASCI